MIQKVKISSDPVNCYLLYICQKKGRKKKKLSSAIVMQITELLAASPSRCSSQLGSSCCFHMYYVLYNKESNSQHTNIAGENFSFESTKVWLQLQGHERYRFVCSSLKCFKVCHGEFFYGIFRSNITEWWWICETGVRNADCGGKVASEATQVLKLVFRVVC